MQPVHDLSEDGQDPSVFLTSVDGDHADLHAQGKGGKRGERLGDPA